MLRFLIDVVCCLLFVVRCLLFVVRSLFGERGGTLTYLFTFLVAVVVLVFVVAVCLLCVVCCSLIVPEFIL